MPTLFGEDSPEVREDPESSLRTRRDVKYERWLPGKCYRPGNLTREYHIASA